MSELYTAQHGEDRWIEQHWDELGLPEQGFFIESGAADGKTFSNTWWLEKVKGWKGLLFEPHAESARKARACREGAWVIERALGNRNGTAMFCQTPEPTLSGLRRTGGRQVEVEIITLTTQLEGLLAHDDYRPFAERIDVLSIDTEGTELDVWAGLDLQRWRPRLVIMEWDTLGLPSQEGAILERMEMDGYALAAKLGGNLLLRPAEATA